MEGIKEEISIFLEKCEQLKTGKFIMATVGIKNILKAVVNSKTLYELFTAVTKDFNYISAKDNCFVTVSDGYFQKSFLRLPEAVDERLAFIFCLLVEFDHGNLNFTNFLQQYFSEDGTYFASFHSFCDKVIVPLENIIKDVYKDELMGKVSVDSSQIKYSKVTTNIPDQKILIALALTAREKGIVSKSQMTEKCKRDGLCILSEFERALNEGRNQSAEACLCGYDYFTRVNNNFSDFINLLSAELN